MLVETNEGTHLRVIPGRKRIEGFSNGAVVSFQFLGACMMLKCRTVVWTVQHGF